MEKLADLEFKTCTDFADPFHSSYMLTESSKDANTYDEERLPEKLRLAKVLLNNKAGVLLGSHMDHLKLVHS